MLMKTALTASLASSLLVLTACSGDGDTDTTYRTPEEGITMDGTTTDTQNGPSVRGVGFEMADGSTTSMDAYQGQVVLVVNTASRCGLTPQVGQLETLQQANAGKSFTVLAFPSASFNQEPLGTAEAAEFCADMGATYPIAAKAEVKGDNAHPLFATLSKQGGEPTWNFTKYLVGKDGTVIARFDPRTSPDDPAIQAAIDEALEG
ncbi:MAG: glutathione peroxidase [Phycisphaera sp.]|nr:MAG: glutathione peroxidase [Phycisphaera sp.]